MRSSIACVRCRRSKVKCVNNGVGTTCRSCENSGRECTYPPPVTGGGGGGGGGRRRDSLAGRPDGYVGGDAERRPRPRKIPHTSTNSASGGLRDSPRPLLDALDSKLLTAQVWQELYDIFQIHYSADLPFLHQHSFLKPLRSAGLQSQQLGPVPEEPTVRPSGSPEFLLAFLALTARFHPRLVVHHSPPTSSRPSNPLIASEYYAAAVNERMATIWTDHRVQNLERIQALLMLGLHEWGMCRGAKAWLTIGVAIRAAQAMGLQYELDLDDEPLALSLALGGAVSKSGYEQLGRPSESGRSVEDDFIQQEIRRRTFWSCYIMDRYLSSGKYRPQMLQAPDLRIQLPASERSFLFAEKVRTLMLGEDDKNTSCTARDVIRSQRHQSVLLGSTRTPELGAAQSPKGLSLRDEKEAEEDNGRLEVGPEEGLVSRYIKVLEIYGKVIKWACLGGRRVEEHPPWDSRSNFNKLLRQCQEFKASLPRQHALTFQNTQAHISMKTSTPYTLLHTVYLLCQVILHREYVPFVPIRCSKPVGPLDSPIFPPEKYAVPAGFWEESARECFRSARGIMDLVQTCHEWGALVETPIVGFAVYTVAFAGVYCTSFPWMDPDGYMCTRMDPAGTSTLEKPGESKGLQTARKALEMVGMLRNRLHMANGWFTTINRMHRYYRRMKKDYKKNAQAAESGLDGNSPESTRHLSLREGGPGGGLDDFKVLERTLQDFGNLEDQDVEMTDVSRRDSRPFDAVYDDSNSAVTVKSEEAGDKGHGATPAAPESQKHEGGAWSAINTVSATSSSRQPSISTPSSGQFRSYESYPAQPTQQPSTHSHSQQLPPPHQGFTPGIASFRPTYTETPGSAAALPSLTSPATYSATTSTPQSQTSPPYDRQQSHSNWHAPNSSAYSTPAHPTPLQNHHASGTPAGSEQQQLQQQQHYDVTRTDSAHFNHDQSSHTPQQPPSAIMTQADAQAGINGIGKEPWRMPYDTMISGDDVAAFAYGSEIGEWAADSANAGWLHGVWQATTHG